jgi:hypothetical protein
LKKDIWVFYSKGKIEYGAFDERKLENAWLLIKKKGLHCSVNRISVISKSTRRYG